MWIKNKDTITNCEHIVRIEIGDSMIEDGELCIFAIDDLGRCKCIGKFNTKKKTQEIFSNICLRLLTGDPNDQGIIIVNDKPKEVKKSATRKSNKRSSSKS